MRKLIEKLSIKVFEYIYARQQQAHEKRMAKLKKSLKNGALSAKSYGQKISTAPGATLTIGNDTTQKRANQEKIEALIKKYMYDTHKLFEYIKGAKTPVYKVKNAKAILNRINECEGLIYPKYGFDALYLNLILAKRLSFKTPEMFVVSSFDVNLYAFIYQFYNWYCYKMGLVGYDIQTREKFKHVFEICETNKIDRLTFQETLDLKGAIKRDREAIEFVENFVKNYEKSKKLIDEAGK